MHSHRNHIAFALFALVEADQVGAARAHWNFGGAQGFDPDLHLDYAPNGTLRDTVVYSVIAGEWPTVRRGLDWRLQQGEQTHG